MKRTLLISLVYLILTLGARAQFDSPARQFFYAELGVKLIPCAPKSVAPEYYLVRWEEMSSIVNRYRQSRLFLGYSSWRSANPVSMPGSGYPDQLGAIIQGRDIGATIIFYAVNGARRDDGALEQDHYVVYLK